MKFKFFLKDKILFYCEYLILKVFCIWFEVKKPKVKMFFYEILYSAMKLIDYDSLWPSPFRNDLIETKFGIFRIRPRTADMANVSPAFERRDIDYLLQLIDKQKTGNKKALFVDVGADIGTFTITVGNRFRDYRTLRIMSFEPAESSFALLEENIQLNRLGDSVETHKFALFNEDNKEISFHFNPAAPGSSGLRPANNPGNSLKVKTKTLDSVLAEKLDAYDVILLKLDVEGVEVDVLQGGVKVRTSGKDIYLLVEDFVNPAIIKYLEEAKAEFLCKLTPYNSWWYLRSSPPRNIGSSK